MIKIIGKRFLPIMMAIIMVISLMPVIQMPASAADVSGLADHNINLSYSAGTWSASGQTINGSVTGSSGMCSDEAANGKLTIKNNKTSPATLSFSYAITLNEGTAKIDGEEVTSNGTFNKEIAAGGTIDIEITSAKGAKTTSIVITNITLLKEGNATVTFQISENGHYMVDGAEISQQTQITKSSSQPFVLSATAENGYRFFGWMKADGEYLSFTADYNMQVDEDITIKPVFIPSSAPVFKVESVFFTDLNDAINYSIENSKNTIVLAESGILPAGNYIIPNGKTLLIPMDDAYTLVKDKPEIIYGAHTNPSAYRLLTMVNGASITVASGGAISLASQLSSTGQLAGWNGTPTGPDGRIKMENGSSITVQEGGNLYAWGYIYGSGSVIAESGSTIHEAFQIKDWRGGTATSKVYKYAFIMSQYYVQNIEVPLTLYAGANEKLYSAANAGGSAYPMGATFVGNGGLFNIDSGYIVKDYIEASDRLQVDAYGSVSITPMTLTGLPMIGSISTNDYILPITSNITINVHEGITAEITQDIEMLPSAEINVDTNAILNIQSGKRVYVYDNDNWKNFTGSARLYPIGYSVANGTATKRNNSSLKDATIKVNGIMNVGGSLFTSDGGAKISSDGGGKIILVSTPTSTSTIYEMENNDTQTSVHFTAAKLQNADGTYVETDEEAAGSKILYVSGKWGGDKATITFDANGGVGTMASQKITISTDATLNNNSFTREGYSFAGWNMSADGSGIAYSDGATVNLIEDITLYAQWECEHAKTEVRGATEATCTEIGYTGDTYCKNCGKKISDGTEIEALGHDWGAGEVTSAASCDEAGVMTYTCTRCGETKVEAISATGHLPMEVEAVVPTCTEPGYTEGHKCSVCGAILDGCEEISALGHSPVSDAAIAPTCTETGLTEGSHCSTCGEVIVEQKEVSALGHTNEIRNSKEPTLIEDGYTGDVYCTICGELLEEGQIIPKTGVIITFNVNGGDGDTFETVLPVNDTLRFEDVFASRYGFELVGWNTKEDGSGTAYDPKGTAAFSEDVVLYAQWIRLDGWYQVDDNYYYSKDGQNVTGVQRLPYPDEELLSGYGPDAEDAEVNVPGKEGNPENYDYPDANSAVFVFDENGVFQKNLRQKYDDNGTIRWIENGMLVWHAGLVQDGEDFYYFKRNGLVTNQETYVAKTNGLLKPANYSFDSEGKLMKLDGLQNDLNGKLCYYVDYVKTYGGLVQDEDGNYYYIASDFYAVKNTTYYVTKTNNLLPSGYYVFDEDGRIIIKDGFVEESGEFYYYENGSKVDKGLVEHDGAYYYFPSALKAVKNEKHYVFADKANGLVEPGWYWFGADGEMFMDGLRKENGKTYYYKDGIKNYAGLIEIDGDYYYIRSDCSAVVGQSYYVTRNNGLMESKTYLFDDDGKMIIKNGIYREKLDDGKEYLFYYVDNVRQMNTGLTQLADGKYIYVRSGANLAVGDYYVYNNNGLLPRGTYHFGDDGIMVS